MTALKIFLVIALIAGVLLGSWVLVGWAFRHDMNAAEKACAELGAKPEYTYRTRYICITPDGRVVG